MKERIKILLVEGEITLAMVIKDTLRRNDFTLTIAASGEEGLRMFFDTRPDVLTANAIMPRMDGSEMVRRIRQTDRQTPVLFLTARSAISDVVEGFGLGANDYLKEPFGIQELIVRIRALVGKTFSFAEGKKITTRFEIGNYLFSTFAQTLTHVGLKQGLSHRRTKILKRLCGNQNQVVNTQNVLLDLQGGDSFFNSRGLHIFIAKPRHKLSADERICIVNARGIGYKLILN